MKNIAIRIANPADLPAYIDLIQRTAQARYPAPELGFTPELLARDAFKIPRIHEYFASNLDADPAKHVWVAESEHSIIGTITLIEHGERCELKGFYVDPSRQKQGIGSQLWALALGIIDNREVYLDTYAHNEPTIAMYKHWGFEVDTTKPSSLGTWPGLPDDHRVQAMYMRRPSLAQNLEQIGAIKAEMTDLLLELETKATGRVIEKPGAWRHHPKDWV